MKKHYLQLKKGWLCASELQIFTIFLIIIKLELGKRGTLI